ncbi:hypothetical protein HUO09_17850 [Vibrio sp. Y2-5]|uniref:hypothetical protein n=1 Tax=Vibrio sp. Y2-5 TaxID=2743977 RepID=UPI00166103B1|nr:hypothetical protein [Vibrio sp. Y2-5]MBD0788223.1 hypothetical protein [Vibrio sp. Y2-5]
MLEQLLNFDEVTLSITTSPNGQKNVVVMPKGLSAQVITGTKESVHLMKADMERYLNAVVGIRTSSNTDTAIAVSKDKAVTGTTTVGEQTPTTTKTEKNEVLSQLEQVAEQDLQIDDTQMGFDDILNNAFNLS